jgi:hypothetical protein
MRSTDLTQFCSECGAAVSDGGTCRDSFNALLLLEWQIPGGPRGFAHFYAVATFSLQHPHSMNLTIEALEGLRAAVADALAGRATIDDLRQRARQGARKAGRVTRRAGDAGVNWHVKAWPMNIADVLTVDAEANAYGERVSNWARTVVDALDGQRV